MRAALIASLCLAGCASTRLVEKDALRHEHRAEALSQEGRPEAAERERQHAEDLRATARIRSEKSARQHFTWLGHDLFM